MNLNEVKTLIIGTVRAAFQNKKTLDKFDGSSGTLKYNGVPVNNVPVFVADDSPVGSIVNYTGLTPPKDYLICDGTVYNIADYPLLAHHILTQFGSYNRFGGDGITTFAVPSLQKEYNFFSPKMTSNTTPSPYVITASHEYSNEFLAYMSFDNKTNTAWASLSGEKNPWIKIDFGAPTFLTTLRITSTFENTVATAFSIEGSNDDVNYIVLKDYSTSSWATSTTRDIHIDEDKFGNYRYIKITVKKYDGSYGEFSEIQFGTILKIPCIKYQITQNNISKDMVNYSLEEQVIGSWIDGKPLYEKTVEFGNLPNATIKEVKHNIENADNIWICEGYIFNPSGNMLQLNSVHCVNINGQISFHTTVQHIVCNTGKYDRSTYTATVTLRYTKTTDAENSFTPDMLSSIKMSEVVTDEDVNDVIGGI